MDLDAGAPTLPDAPPRVGSSASLTGYTVGEVIGRGGMGEVVAARDERIGREIALKRMRAHRSPELERRFLREARIQARLDHPAIVPVYEVGSDAHGLPYFTMKRLAGTTLAERIRARAPIRPLLHTLVGVARAIDFAHARGVVHRDLKPANIMIGDYGDAYVLDWGVASVRGEVVLRAVTDAIATGLTGQDGILGTPGYMPPEQLLGEDVEPASDVYALGAILFEVLTGEALHPTGQPAFASTLEKPCEAPSSRRPELAIAPELDEACFEALSPDPAARPTAGELAERIQRYLDGDRDLEHRRMLAQQLVISARVLLASGDASSRALAAQRVSRALALDPQHDAAAELFNELAFERPREIAPKLRARFAAAKRETITHGAKPAALALTSLLVLLLVATPFLKINHWHWLVANIVVLVVVIAQAVRASIVGRINTMFIMAGNFALALVGSRIAGVFVLTPVLIAGSLLALAASPPVQRRPWLLYTWVAITVLVPVALEYVGIFDKTWTVTAHSIEIRSAIFGGSVGLESVLLLVGNIVVLCMLALYAIALARAARTAQRELLMQTWALEKLVPSARVMRTGE